MSSNRRKPLAVWLGAGESGGLETFTGAHHINSINRSHIPRDHYPTGVCVCMCVWVGGIVPRVVWGTKGKLGNGAGSRNNAYI